ncbi:MAG: glycosyltransferase, partial [Candidatus Gastranaerophilales bacterium]|nr:glycosyltransferase [Candidatus Gastranaerophilales bacterium]
MEKNPKITVITAVYNLISEGREQSFRDCLESVHNQSYKNIEHIIIYTPCSDGTKELIDEYVAKKWVTCQLQPKEGLWIAMQKGFEVATGDFINFLNSDDKFSRLDAVDLMVNEIVKNDADYAYADAYIVYPASKYYWKAKINNVPFGECYCHQTLFLSTKVMRDLGGFDFNYKLSLDNHLMLKLVLNNKKGVYVNTPIVLYKSDGWSSNLERADLRNDYAINFYDVIGEKMGLTLDECRDLWFLEVINNKTKKYCKQLIRKIKIKEWQDTFKNAIERKYKLYDKGSCPYLKFPAVKFWGNSNILIVKILGIPILAFEKKEQSRICNVLGIPVINFQRKGEDRVIKIFGLFKILKNEKRILFCFLFLPIFRKSLLMDT